MASPILPRTERLEQPKIADVHNGLILYAQIYPGYSPAVAENSTMLSSTDCNYYSCDHSAWLCYLNFFADYYIAISWLRQYLC